MKRDPINKECAQKDCKNRFMQYNSLVIHCCFDCYFKDNPIVEKTKNRLKSIRRSQKRIKPLSGKRKIQEAKYQKQRIEFLSKPENKICFIDHCDNAATTIEHRKGRKGYADDDKRSADIPLLLDEEFFAPCCHSCNLELENNPELSKKYQLSKLHPGKKF
jgi:hypothetical protein